MKNSFLANAVHNKSTQNCPDHNDTWIYLHTHFNYFCILSFSTLFYFPTELLLDEWKREQHFNLLYFKYSDNI